MSDSKRVYYHGEQRAIFSTGRAEGTISLMRLAGLAHLYALGPVAGLDGEITVFDSRPYVSRVRGAAGEYVVDSTFEHDAIFLAWTQLHDWFDVAIPDEVNSYSKLGAFVREAALKRDSRSLIHFHF